jgi:ribosomal protein L37AE/L43A
MRIKEITRQSRRDFYAIYECEHCGHEGKGYGYDDSNFHANVIPKMKCIECEKTAKENYRPLKTKHPDSLIV